MRRDLALFESHVDDIAVEGVKRSRPWNGTDYDDEVLSLRMRRVIYDHENNSSLVENDLGIYELVYFPMIPRWVNSLFVNSGILTQPHSFRCYARFMDYSGRIETDYSPSISFHAKVLTDIPAANLSGTGIYSYETGDVQPYDQTGTPAKDADDNDVILQVESWVKGIVPEDSSVFVSQNIFGRLVITGQDCNE